MIKLTKEALRQFFRRRYRDLRQTTFPAAFCISLWNVDRHVAYFLGMGPDQRFWILQAVGYVVAALCLGAIIWLFLS
jgi:hypothetical protein